MAAPGGTAESNSAHLSNTRTQSCAARELQPRSGRGAMPASRPRTRSRGHGRKAQQCAAPRTKHRGRDSLSEADSPGYRAPRANARRDLGPAGAVAASHARPLQRGVLRAKIGGIVRRQRISLRENGATPLSRPAGVRGRDSEDDAPRRTGWRERARCARAFQAGVSV